LLDDKDIASQVCESLKDTSYNDIAKIDIATHVLLPVRKSIAMKLIAECNESNIYPELVRVFIKPCQDSILKQYLIEGNETLNPSFQELIKLPFIKQL
jgi:hypothetical protein